MADNRKRKCFKCGTSPNSDDPDFRLHRFPKPGTTNMRRCEMWAKYCFPDKAWSCPDFQRKLYSEHRMLCNKHFKDSEFINIEERRLAKHAVPDMEESDVDTGTMMYLQVDDISKTAVDPKSKKATEEVQHGDQDDSDAADDPGSSEVNIPEPPPPPQLYLHSAHMCRVCLVLEVKMFDLRDTELNTMFQMTTGITFKEIKDSKLGRLICWECAARLKAASTFINKALFSESLLRGLIKKGNEIDKQYYESLKEDADNLISPKTLTVTEIVHIVEIEDQNNMTQLVQPRDDDEPALSEKSRDDDEPALSEKSRDDDEPALSENCETEEIIIYETENDQMDVEVYKDVPIETRIDDDPTCPYAEEQNRTELIKEIPLDSTASYKETINSGYSHPDDDTTCPYAEEQNNTKIIKVNPLDSTASCEETIKSGYSHPLHRFLLLSYSTHQVDFEDQISNTFSIKTNTKFKKVPKRHKKIKNPIKRSKVGVGHYHKNYLKGDSEDGIKKKQINILRK